MIYQGRNVVITITKVCSCPEAPKIPVLATVIDQNGNEADSVKKEGAGDFVRVTHPMFFQMRPCGCAIVESGGKTTMHRPCGACQCLPIGGEWVADEQ